ncbi:putative ribonuclease H-like domain-containing protein, partial [Tanacetum coccineum]
VLSPNNGGIIGLIVCFQNPLLFKINEQIVPHFILEFVIQNKLFSLTLGEFGLILGIPIEGQCSFTEKWSLDYLASSVLSNGPYQTTPPTPDDIKIYVQVEREEPITHIRRDQIIDVEENQILTREITPIMKTWVDIFSKPYNLAFFVAKRMEWVSRQAGLILPYGMLLNRLFKRIMSIRLESFSDRCVLYDCVMNPLTAQHERKKQKDYGTKRGIHFISTSSSCAFDHQSSSHHVDEDVNDNDEGISRASTPSPIHAPPRPLNPLPLQRNPSLDITLSLSPINPLDNMFETPSPPSLPPPPQPSLVGHPIYFDVIDYHGAHLNGDSVSPVASASTGAEGPIPPKNAEEKLARKNELKAKSTLMLAIPDEHLLKFHACKDTKSLLEAIKNMFGGNKESKKMQKTILKQNYEKFTTSSQEGLDKTYDRFQKLIGQLEIHGEVISEEDANLKLLRSLPSAWNSIALIMRNKSDLDTLSMDDLYNNLKVYESDIKGKSSSSSNSQNVAFVSSDNSNNTNETINTTHNVSAASSKDQASTASYVDDVMFSFFSNQSSALQLDYEDLEQIDVDDLEEMDLKWQVAMLTMRVNRFIKKTGRKMDLNDKETVGFDRTKGNRNRDAPRRNAPVDTSTTNALVVQNAIGGYDWSFEAKEGITNFALMAYTSQGSSSSASECEALNKSNLEIIGYQMGLESLEARIVVHEKNEAVYEEDIAFLKYDVHVKDISIKDLKNQLEEALKEKDDLKLKLNFFEESSKNLTKLIDSQISSKHKTGLGYDSQMNESEVVHSVFNSRESDVDDSLVNDRFKTGEGFHAVPPPYTGNYMPSRPDLSFVGLDDSVYKTKVSETETSISKTSKDIVEKPKTVRPSAPIIEEWDTDSDNDSVFRPKSDQTKPKFTKINFQIAVATKSGQVPVNAAKQSSPRAATSISNAYVRSINHKIYCLVVTDDYSRFSWVFFLSTKDETSGILKTFITGIENQINHKVKIIRCDNGTEFKNNDINQFCGMKGIKREFSVARTPQQNGVAERKNRTLIEAARTMLADSLLPTTFWAEAVSTACYVQNRVLVTKPHNKTPYELLHGRPPSISFMRPFGCPMTILNTLDPLGKFDGKADEGFFVGYSINSKAFRVFNTRTRKVEENLHITFLENKPNVAGSGPDWLFDIDLLTNSMNYEPVTVGNQSNKNAGIKYNVDVVPTKQYILLPLLYDSPQSSKDLVADDAGKKTNEEPANKGERNGQEKEGGASNKEDDQNVQDFRAELDNLLV